MNLRIKNRLQTCAVQLLFVLSFLLSFTPVKAQNVDCNVALNVDISAVEGCFTDIVCTEVSVLNFNDVLSVQFPFNFDPTILRYDHCENSAQTGTLGLNCDNVFDFDSDVGLLRVLWFDIDGQPRTVPDQTVLVSLCFEIIGEPIDNTPIIVTDFGLPVEYTVDAGNNDVSILNEICYTGGRVSICCPTFSVFNSTCSTPNGTTDGLINFYACGGFPPYNWSLNGETGVLSDDRETFALENLSPGNYTLVVMDAMGDSQTQNITINNGPALDLSIIAEDPSCATGRFPSGRIMADATGGAAPYNFSWNITPVNTEIIEELANGDYSVTVKDAAGCQLTENITLFTAPIEVVVDITNLPACEGGTRLGTAIITASGGSPINGTDYEFEVIYPDGSNEDFITSQWFVQIPPGEIQVVARDGSSFCESDTMTIVVLARKSLELDLTQVNVGCTSTDDGSINVTLSSSDGSTPLPDFTYVLEDNTGTLAAGPINIDAAEYTFENLIAGIYNVRVVDGEGCEATGSIEVEQGVPLGLSLVNLTQPGCTGTGLGSIEVVATGGEGMISYVWDDGPMGSLRSDLVPGNYTVTAMDETNCSASETWDLNIDNSGALVLDTIIVTPLLCRGEMNAAISIEVLGGNEGISFDWGDGITTDNTRFGLGAGMITVDIQSTNGCGTIETIEIPEIMPFAHTVNEDSPLCPGLFGNIGIEVTGGTAPYGYNWDHPNNTGGSVLAAVTAGDYTVVVTDTNNCTYEAVVTLNDPPEIVAQVSNETAVGCFGFSDGQATVSASGGVAGGNEFQYFWSSMEQNFGVTATANSLSAGTQWVIATDNQCVSDTVFFEIASPDSIEIDFDQSMISPPTCFGMSDGELTLMAMGGNAPYTYQWPQLGTQGANQINLGSDTLVVFIRDNNNCEQERRFFLEQPDSLQVFVDSLGSTNVSCFSESTAVVAVNHFGGNPGGVDYQWTDNVSTTNVATGLTLGLYEITVTDSQGCEASTFFEVQSPAPIVADIPLPEPPLCFGDRGQLVVNEVEGGSGAPYNFTINNGPLISIDSTISLLPGDYAVKVFDSSGCFTETEISILQAQELLVDIPDTLELDLGTSQLINVQVSGPVAIDSFSWTPMENIDCLTDLCNSININAIEEDFYTIRVSDINGCVATDRMLLLVRDERNVFIPNAFNPAQGLDNQLPIFTGIGVTRVEFFRIFDRLGNLMHEGSGNASRAGVAPWDGKYRGQLVNPGVYVYSALVEFDDGEKINYTGTITVVK